PGHRVHDVLPDHAEPGRVGVKRAGLGFRVHSGWAALVAIAEGPEVVDRRRIEMADTRLAGSVQPYHAAEGKPVRQAAALIGRLEKSAAGLALQGLTTAVAELRTRGYVAAG